MSNFTIDFKARKSDIEQVRNLIKETGVFSDEEIKVSAELVEETLKNPEVYQFIFLRDKNELAAYSCYGEICLTNKRFDLYWIAVAKKYQKQNLASMVLAETEKQIKELGGVKLYAETSSLDFYIPARNFYLKSGFKQVAQMKDFYKDQDDKVVFCKDIK